MGVVVFVDHHEGKITKSSLEAVVYASKIDANCAAVSYSNIDQGVLAGLGKYGAKKVISHGGLDHFDNSLLAKLVAQVASDENAEVVVFSHDFSGRSIAPMVAGKLQAGIVSGVVDYPNTNGTFTVKKAVFSGKAFAEFDITSEKKVLTVLPNSIDITTGEGSAEVLASNMDLGTSRIRVKEFKKKGGEGKIDLTEAELVVSAGRGLKGPENWGAVEELASVLGAATACSRPVADIGWRPHHEHVGQTGIAIAPNLYIAAGISGAIQHLAGVNRSKVIVVINTDPEAPFFKAADYGIVGDAFQVLPKLVEAAKKLKANA